MLNLYGQSKTESPASGHGLIKKPSIAFRIGLILGSVHLFYILFNVIDIIRLQEGRWHMFWILCGYIDFPVTLLLSRVILPVVAPLFTWQDPYLVASRGPLFIIFLLFHSLVGSAWYFALPILISKASAKIASTKVTRAAVAVILIVPIPSHWLQLVRFFGYDTAPAAIGLNSVLPVVWTVIFIWLLIVNVRRKVLLWLVCLAPFVFYYLVQDLYYCIVLAHR